MSGWLKSQVPKWLAKIAYRKASPAAKSAVESFDQQWDKESGAADRPIATVTQKEVNIVFRKKEDMIRRNSFLKR